MLAGTGIKTMVNQTKLIVSWHGQTVRSVVASIYSSIGKTVACINDLIIRAGLENKPNGGLQDMPTLARTTPSPNQLLGTICCVLASLYIVV